MKIEDFKEINDTYIETCKQIINRLGICENILCKYCPFDTRNSIKSKVCGDKYCTPNLERKYVDTKLLKSAREFLEMCKPTESGTVTNDNIKSPNHYKLDGLNCETIDVVKARLGKEGFKAFCIGNILKYVLRAEKKNGLEDYKKSRQYLDWLIEGEEK